MNVMNIVPDAAKSFVWKIALGKGLKALAKIAVSAFMTWGVSITANINGVQLDTTTEAGMLFFLNSIVAILSNTLKTKWPEKFAWM